MSLFWKGYIFCYTNYFLFNGHFCLQQRGAAMGASFTPTNANLVMGWWERIFIFGNQNPYKHQIIRFYRYIDDYIGVWEGDEVSLASFMDYCNHTVKCLQFTYETHISDIPLLDVIFQTQGDKITTTLFSKPITCNTLLHAQSSHPASCLKGIPVENFYGYAAYVLYGMPLTNRPCCCRISLSKEDTG